MRGGFKHTTAHTVIYLKRVEDNSARFGFVVSKAVGSAVKRNLVKRRLRALAQELLPQSAGLAVVVRALEGSADVSFDELKSQFLQGIEVLKAKVKR